MATSRRKLFGLAAGAALAVPSVMANSIKTAIIGATDYATIPAASYAAIPFASVIEMMPIPPRLKRKIMSLQGLADLDEKSWLAFTQDRPAG